MNISPKYHPDRHANVCLLLEGTYPYIRGGVSSWVKQLIEGMPALAATKSSSLAVFCLSEVGKVTDFTA